jgi:hypothetical protein
MKRNLATQFKYTFGLKTICKVSECRTDYPDDLEYDAYPILIFSLSHTKSGKSTRRILPWRKYAL